MTKRLTINEVKEYIETNSDCKLLSTEYKNVREKLKLQCSCGKNFECNYADIKKKEIIQCNDCSRKMVNKKNTKTYEEAYNSIYNKIGERFEILPFEYIGKQKTEVYIICKNCNEKFTRNYHTINTRGIKCPKCESDCKKWDKERATELVAKYSNEFKVLKCENGNEIIIEHECGCVFTKRYFNIEQNKCVKCPKCHSSESFGVKTITNYLDKNNIEYIKEYRFANCKDIKTLPFDFYLPKYNCCIEYDGQQHFKPNGFSSGYEHFVKTVEHDRMKDQYCKDNNILLIRIRYDENTEIENILSNILK